MRAGLVRTLILVATCGAAPSAMVLLAGGCSGDNGAPATSNDGSADSTAESGSDQASPDVAEASNPSDSLAPADASDSGATADGDSSALVADSGDAGAPGDAGDGGAPRDAGDGGAPSDGGDAGDGSAASDAGDGGLSLGTYMGDIVAAYCRQLQSCCLLGDSMWNQTLCTTAVHNGGGFLNLDEYEGSVASGHVSFNAATGARCIADVPTLSCGGIESLAILSLQYECYSALVGTLGPDGGTCATSLECGENLYCSAGTCVPILATGGTCTHAINDECEYRGAQSAYCNLPSDGGPGQCESAQANGTSCVASPSGQCLSGVCNYPTCAAQEPFADPGVAGGTCAYFTLGDGG